MVKNGMKKVLILLLVLLMLVPAVAACKKNTPDATDGGSDVAGGSETETDKYAVGDNIGDIDLGARAIKIAQPGQTNYMSEVKVERLTGDVVSDAIFKRNAAVEKRLNCKIDNVVKTSAYQINEALEKDVMNGIDPGFELILGTSYIVTQPYTKGVYVDLNEVKNLDLSQPYWSQLINETCEIGGVQYLATGAVSLTYYKCTHVNVLNERILGETTGEVPDVIGMVKDGKWTIENTTALAKQYYVDYGDPGRSDDDISGYITDTSMSVDAYLSSGQIQILKKGEDGYYSYQFDNVRAQEVLDDLAVLFGDDAIDCNFPDAINDKIKKFASGGALMAGLDLIDLETQSIKDMEDDYVILPTAKWSEDQDYYSGITDTFSLMGMVATVTGDEVGEVGAFMEVLASESYSIVTKSYFETVLRGRYSENNDRWEILEMITDNVTMDASQLFTITLQFPELESSGQTARETTTKLWRYSVLMAYKKTPKSIDTVFTNAVGTVMEEKLNGTNGLQTYIRAQLANG